VSKDKIAYSCTECGGQQPKWAGQCPDCGAWNSLVEIAALPIGKARDRFGGFAGTADEARACNLDEVAPDDIARVPVGIGELDRVLGGGLVRGSVTLIGGDPGIGKSTLLLQAVMALAGRAKTLYVSGEESLQQVSVRAHRLGLADKPLRLVAATRVEAILANARSEQPQVMVVDSIQTMYTDVLQSAPGSVAQVRESAAQLVRFAKQGGTAVFLIGHVTKEGTIAGPRVLEHMVDTVLYFEGEAGNRYRVIRAIKNRFGAVNELGVFAMTERGLREVTNPSAIFLSRHAQPVSGSVIMVTLEGTRPLLVEVQALVDDSQLANPRRLCVGLEHNRLSMLLAVLHRHGGIVTSDQDVFANVVGGMRVSETAADLAILTAVVSSMRDRALASDLVVFGEVGLAGEIRPVPNGQDRLQEAAKHGFKRAIVPQANAPKRPPKGLQVNGVTRLEEALQLV